MATLRKLNPRNRRARRGGKRTTNFERKERRRIVMELAAQNYSTEDIAAELKVRAERSGRAWLAVTVRTVRSDIQVGMNALREATLEAGEEIRQLMAAKIQAAERRAWRHVDSSDPSLSLRGIEAVLKCVDRWSRLYGCDAPRQLEVTEGPDNLRLEIVTADEVDRRWLSGQEDVMGLGMGRPAPPIGDDPKIDALRERLGLLPKGDNGGAAREGGRLA